MISIATTTEERVTEDDFPSIRWCRGLSKSYYLSVVQRFCDNNVLGMKLATPFLTRWWCFDPSNFIFALLAPFHGGNGGKHLELMRFFTQDTAEKCCEWKDNRCVISWTGLMENLQMFFIVAYLNAQLSILCWRLLHCLLNMPIGSENR